MTLTKEYHTGVIRQSKTSYGFYYASFSRFGTIAESDKHTHEWMERFLAWLGLDQCISTSGPINTSIGDRLLVGKPSQYVTSHRGQLSLLSLRGM